MKFTDRQETTIAFALTSLAGVFIFALILLIFYLLAIFLNHFSDVFLPVAVAAVAAMICQPYYDLMFSIFDQGPGDVRSPLIRMFLSTLKRFSMPLSISVVFLTALIPFGVFCWFFGSLLVDQILAFIHDFPGWWKETSIWMEKENEIVRQFFEGSELGASVKKTLQEKGPNIVQELASMLMSSTGSLATDLGSGIRAFTGTLIAWAITPIYMAFFLMTKRKSKLELEHFLPFFKEETRTDIVFLARQFIGILVAFFRGQLIIAFLQGLMLAIGFYFVGLKYGLVLGFVLGFLNAIPYLGSTIGLALTIPLAMLQVDGGLFTVAMVLLVFTIVQSIEGYYLTPKIIGDQTGLHPMVIIFAIFFWGAALGGILGMILGIPLTAFLVVFWRLAKEKYIPEIV